MRILTERSVFGHHGVWSLVPFEVLREFQKRASVFAEWESPNFLDDRRMRTGVSHSLINYGYDDGPMVRLGWHPQHLADAMKSISILDRFALRKGESFTEPALEILAHPTPNGWVVKANFGDPVWDVIESERFAHDLSQINKKIKTFWEDATNKDESAQFASMSVGINGPTLQVYHPGSQGLWIAGARNHSGVGSFQMCDHNTVSAEDAFAHIYALCVILEHCRTLLPQS